MNVGLIILRVASERRDAQNERDGARAAQPATAPSQQHYNLALKCSSHRRVPPRGAAGSTSRRNTAQPRGGTRAARSISSVAAASAPSQQHQLRRSRQQHQQATAVSCDDERSTGAHLLKLFQNDQVSPLFLIKQYSIWEELGVTHPV